MKIFLVSQNANREYDTYDSFVCIAKSAQRAKVLHPTYSKSSPEIISDLGFDSSAWVSNPKFVKVKCIGTANKNLSEQIVCTSFNAG